MAKVAGVAELSLYLPVLPLGDSSAKFCHLRLFRHSEQGKGRVTQWQMVAQVADTQNRQARMPRQDVSEHDTGD